MQKQSSSKAMLQVRQKAKVFIVYNHLHLLHNTTRKHPEVPERVACIVEQLQHMSPCELKEVIKSQIVGQISQEYIEKCIKKIHGENYYEFIKEMWDQMCKKSELYINKDTYYMKETYRAAFEAVKTTLYAVQIILKGIKRYAFAVIRPPGHHSGLKSQPHGFSFFNNVAIASEYLIQKKKSKIAIIDWDVHHGQGTQNIFYKRRDVLYCSLHRYDNGKYFPHISQSNSKMIGQEQGKGYNINICWNLPEKPANSTYQREESVGDQQYVCAFKRIVVPILKQYAPDYIFVSCGFDSGDGDLIGNLKISRHGYMYMMKQLKKITKEILLVLEGGYNFQVLKWASQSVVDVLNDQVSTQDELKVESLGLVKQCNKIGEEGIKEAISHIGKCWNLE